ncbi:MAG: hypothetical protein J7493_15915 [Porphyrobacter sp.]|nr:hypothetical protein [Porphyrobacter sp.]
MPRAFGNYLFAPSERSLRCCNYWCLRHRLAVSAYPLDRCLMRTSSLVALGASALALVAVTAGATAYLVSKPADSSVAAITAPAQNSTPSSFSSAAPVAAAAPARKAAPPLSAYVGKYNFDKVQGVRFLDHPLVRAAINAAVPPGEVRDQMYVTRATFSPIIKVGNDRLYSRAFAGPGSDENWGILIAMDGSKAAVCYSSGVIPDVQGADWYADGEKAITLYLPCFNEADEIEDSLGDFPIGAIPG